MSALANLKESKQIRKSLGARASCPHLFCAGKMPVFPGGQSARAGKIRISLIIVLLALVVSVLAGCGGDSGGGSNYNNNNNNNSQPAPQTYSVSFITNGGSSVMARSVQQGGAISASPDTAREGYVFDGWFTDNNTFINRVSFPYTPTGNITLYAGWTANAPSNTAPQIADISALQRNVLMIHVTWSDRRGINTPKLNGSRIYDLVFNPSTRSVNDYYKELFGQTEDVILPADVNNQLDRPGIIEIELPGRHPDIGTDHNRGHELMERVLAAASSDGYIDFSTFDVNGNGTLEAT